MYPEAEAYIKKTLEVGVAEADLSAHEVIDYMAVEDVGYEPKRWARMRGVNEKTVEKNVRAAKRIFEI